MRKVNTGIDIYIYDIYDMYVCKKDAHISVYLYEEAV